MTESTSLFDRPTTISSRECALCGAPLVRHVDSAAGTGVAGHLMSAEPMYDFEGSAPNDPQDHPDLDPRDIGIVTRNEYAFRATRWQEINAERATPTVTAGRCRQHPDGPHTHTAWDGILLEEVYEALAEPDPEKLLGELLQVEAVARQWRMAIRRRLAAEGGEG